MDAIPGVSVIGIDPRALIMAPTRELAIQLAKECLKLCRGFDCTYLKHKSYLEKYSFKLMILKSATCTEEQSAQLSAARLLVQILL